MRLITILLGVCTLALVASTPALAKAPPLGKYHCYIGTSNLNFSTVSVLSGNSYTRNGTKGTFQTGATKVTFKDRKVGYTIRFTSGTLKGFSGRWYAARGAGVTHEIALKTPTSGYETVYCDDGR